MRKLLQRPCMVLAAGAVLAAFICAGTRRKTPYGEGPRPSSGRGVELVLLGFAVVMVLVVLMLLLRGAPDLQELTGVSVLIVVGALFNYRASHGVADFWSRETAIRLTYYVAGWGTFIIVGFTILGYGEVLTDGPSLRELLQQCVNQESNRL